MKHLALALFASLFVVGCGFVDESIHMSDEELRTELEGSGGYGSGSFISGRGISSGCGIAIHGAGHGHYHKQHHYNFDASHISLRLPSSAEPPRAIGGIEPPALAAVETEPEEPAPVIDPVPRHVQTWGQMVEWYYENARRRGDIDTETQVAVERWKP